MLLMSTASHSSFELDEDDLDGKDADVRDVGGDHVDRGDHELFSAPGAIAPGALNHFSPRFSASKSHLSVCRT